MQRFVGKAVVVTGGSGGIGSALVQRFVSEGAFVYSLDLPTSPAPPSLPSSLAIPCDVSSLPSVTSAMRTILAHSHGKCHVLVNNAAAFVLKSCEDTTEADWDRTLAVNIKGYSNMMAAALPAMKAGGGGAIVNISSVSAFYLQKNFVPYSTSKAAQLHLTRLVARDEGPHGVRVNAVCPGFIFTDLTRKHAMGVGRSVEEVRDEMAADTILKRMGRPEEVCGAVAFLASEEASFITGTTLVVDGGTYPR